MNTLLDTSKSSKDSQAQRLALRRAQAKLQSSDKRLRSFGLEKSKPAPRPAEHKAEHNETTESWTIATLNDTDKSLSVQQPPPLAVNRSRNKAAGGGTASGREFVNAPAPPTGPLGGSAGGLASPPPMPATRECATFTADEWYNQVKDNYNIYMGEDEGTDYRQAYRWMDTLYSLGGRVECARTHFTHPPSRPICRQFSRFAIDVGAHAGTFSDKLRWRFPTAAFVLIEADPTLYSNWLVPGYGLIHDTQVFNKAVDAVSNTRVNLTITGNSMDGAVTLSTTTLDDFIPSELTVQLRMRYDTSNTVFLKTDVEGMDELVLKGFQNALSRRAGQSVVQIIQLEFAPQLMREVNRDTQVYNLLSTVAFLERHGFAVFWIGPNFIPLSHGAWNDKYLELVEDPIAVLGEELGGPMANKSLATDLLAVREDYPHLVQMKQLLGSCKAVHAQ
jgi:FkbM family methyltransferase